MNPEARVMQARLAAHTRWSREPDRRAATEKARTAFRDRFEREVVEAARERGEELTDPVEIARRATHARKAYMTRLALKSARARQGQTAEPTPESVSFLGTDDDSTARHGS